MHGTTPADLRVVELVRLDGADAGQAEDAVRLVYSQVFAQPPYGKTADEVAANMRRFARQIKREGFRAAVAYDGDEPVGIGYGYPLSSSTGWWDVVEPPVSDDVRRENGRRTFGLIELAVRPPWRGRGVVRHLHDLVVDGPEERVILNTRPDADAAQAAYRSWGYERIGRGHPWDGAGLHDILLLTRSR
ncbi:N-acetyltransferase family protein [Yinghuangia sp. YIM S09857]|uniref:GNAT family N-acetyltransferase n=1 Tax=Yinghuangia sp. YIM S09857 TaxID=3436929 RepID=UPI003F531299